MPSRSEHYVGTLNGWLTVEVHGGGDDAEVPPRAFLRGEDCLAWFRALVGKNVTTRTTVTYIRFQPEIGTDTGNRHIQFYVQFSSAVELKSVKKLFSAVGHPHLEAARGSAEEADKYCHPDKPDGSADPDYESESFGEMKDIGRGAGKGSREDLKAVHQMILDGADWDTIRETHFEVVVKYNSLR